MKKYTIISIITVFLGIIFFAYYNEILILMPIRKASYQISDITAVKSKINIYYWKDDSWKKEEKEILLPANKAQSLTYIINFWLNFIDEEQSTKKISLESVIVDPNSTEAYVSFNKSPFKEEQSIFDRLIWVDSLLKTIKSANLPIQTLRFLVHNKPLRDSRLDFSKPWPIDGFIN